MIRATLDVNVLASGFPSQRGVPSELIGRWGQRQYAVALATDVRGVADDDEDDLVVSRGHHHQHATPRWTRKRCPA